MNTPTPETDAMETFILGTDTPELVLKDDARKLERERDEVWKLANAKAEEAGMFRAERDQLRKVLDSYNSLPHVQQKKATP